MARKFITYFDKQGEDYTDELISIVKDKLDMAENIKYILIASASGESALKLAEAIDKDVTIINVSHNVGFSGDNESDISDEMIEKLQRSCKRSHQQIWRIFPIGRCSRYIKNVFTWCKGVC